VTPAQRPGRGKGLPPSFPAGLLHWVLAVSAAQPVTFRSRGAGCWGESPVGELGATGLVIGGPTPLHFIPPGLGGV
jgi:hypothetical protein